MDIDIARQWTAALRSGEYQQGKGALNREGKLCCLGVLCEMYDNQFPNDLRIQRDDWNDSVSYNGEDELPPAIVLDWAGVSDKYGTINSDWIEDETGSRSYLAELNDEYLTFDQIADVIDYFASDL